MNGFAKPRFAPPADSLASAVIPAMSGAAALVPPTMFQTATEPPPSPWLQMMYPV